MTVALRTRDERTIRIPVPADQAETGALVEFLVNAADDGYLVVGADSIDGGSQRDPYTIGLCLTLRRPA